MKFLTLQSVALLALVANLPLFTGCDTSSHGSSPTTAELSGSGTGSDAATPTTDQTAAGNADAANHAEATDTDAAAKAEPMPLPVRNDDEVIDITFDDVNLQMQADMVFRPFLITDRVRQLEGRRVRIGGVMYATDRTRGITEFVLLKNTECKFGPGGMADHLVSVTLKDGETTTYPGDKPISVEGVLRVNPFQGPDGFTWSVYDLEMAENVQPLIR